MCEFVGLVGGQQKARWQTARPGLGRLRRLAGSAAENSTGLRAKRFRTGVAAAV